jgi:hypothetical protein
MLGSVYVDLRELLPKPSLLVLDDLMLTEIHLRVERDKQSLTKGNRVKAVVSLVFFILRHWKTLLIVRRVCEVVVVAGEGHKRNPACDALRYPAELIPYPPILPLQIVRHVSH